jgi:cyclohexyl-isocyanide hydratase
VVLDGNLVSAAGVTAGIDGALRVAALLCGTQKAQEIQLNIQYAPDPPFNSGSVATAPPEVVNAVLADYQALTDARLVTARRIRANLGIEDSRAGNG